MRKRSSDETAHARLLSRHGDDLRKGSPCYTGDAVVEIAEGGADRIKFDDIRGAIYNMPKGNRGGQRGTTPNNPGGTTPKGPVQSATDSLKLDSDTIEYDGTLNYYPNDATLTGAARTNTEAWEKKRAKAKVEYASAFKSDGTPIGEVRGGKGSVRSPLSYHYTPDSTFTHIHPRDNGMLGGTFSTADLNNFARGTNVTCRAVAKEGTYSISKAANFDSQGFSQYIAQENSAARSSYTAASNALSNEYTSGKITYSEYKTRAAKAFNTYLVDLHSRYKAGESKYGYNYTLERRT